MANVLLGVTGSGKSSDDESHRKGFFLNDHDFD